MSLGISTCAEELARTLARIGEEVEPALHLVSQAARDEWRALQNRWQPDGGGEELVSLTEEEIQAVEAKARRFRDIVCSLVPKVSGRPTPLYDGPRPGA
jgi:hypothetical protein